MERDKIEEAMMKRTHPLLYKTARQLFKDAVEFYNVRQFWCPSIGITDLIFRDNGMNCVNITVALRQYRDQDTRKFYLEDTGYRNAIYFSVYHGVPVDEKAVPMEIHGVTIYGLEHDEYEYRLYVEDVSKGVMAVLRRVFFTFNAFYNHIHMDMRFRVHLNILNDFNTIFGFGLYKEVSIYRPIAKCWMEILMKNLERVQRVNFLGKSKYIDVSAYPSVCHVKIERGNMLDVDTFHQLDYEKLEVENLAIGVKDMILFMQDWKRGEIPKVRELKFKFLKAFKGREKTCIRRRLRGIRRGDNEEFNSHGCCSDILKLYNATNYVSHNEDYGAYVITPASFSFVVYETYEERNDPTVILGPIRVRGSQKYVSKVLSARQMYNGHFQLKSRS